MDCQSWGLTRSGPAGRLLDAAEIALASPCELACSPPRERREGGCRRRDLRYV